MSKEIKTLENLEKAINGISDNEVTSAVKRKIIEDVKELKQNQITFEDVKKYFQDETNNVKDLYAWDNLRDNIQDWKQKNNFVEVQDFEDAARLDLKGELYWKVEVYQASDEYNNTKKENMDKKELLQKFDNNRLYKKEK